VTDVWGEGSGIVPALNHAHAFGNALPLCPGIVGRSSCRYPTQTRSMDVAGVVDGVHSNQRMTKSVLPTLEGVGYPRVRAQLSGVA
jgi:hypothetical protein